MSNLHLAELELLRFFRRRETFWTVLVLAVVLVLPMLLIRGVIARPDLWPFSARDYPGKSIIQVAETSRNLLFLLEGAVVLAATYFLAYDSLSSEVKRGTFALLEQTPVSTSRLLFGKGIGIAFSVLALHSICFLGLVAYTPLLRRPHAAVAGDYFWIWICSLCFIPEGFWAARVYQRPAPHPAWLNSLARLAIPFFVLQALVRPEIRATGGLGRWWIDHLFGVDPRPASACFVVPHAPLSVFLIWQALSALILARFFLGAGRR